MNRTTVSARTREGDVEEWDEPLVEAFLNASRVLVAVAARSLAAGDTEITLPQYRSLVVLASRGPQRVSDLAVLLAVNTSTATRQCDRLERRGLLERARSSDDRRSVVVSITPVGLALVQRVSDARREEIGRILGSMTPSTATSCSRHCGSSAPQQARCRSRAGPWAGGPTWLEPESAPPGARSRTRPVNLRSESSSRDGTADAVGRARTWGAA
ncbi:MarR family winged helix-turn-helix transcriptional regulator [Cellulomonas sp. JZ18]|uniref:MarR family winged helix-turn-helix transcriptional regulator n=1 Tax=Cellulomonas sp. JZ18 TaxID=2654191 RepID=UPI001E45060E|nr:MarR family transcriptional regulator [Cellulomonas sp. JZ18]